MSRVPCVDVAPEVDPEVIATEVGVAVSAEVPGGSAAPLVPVRMRQDRPEPSAVRVAGDLDLGDLALRDLEPASRVGRRRQRLGWTPALLLASALAFATPRALESYGVLTSGLPLWMAVPELAPDRPDFTPAMWRRQPDWLDIDMQVMGRELRMIHAYKKGRLPTQAELDEQVYASDTRGRLLGPATLRLEPLPERAVPGQRQQPALACMRMPVRRGEGDQVLIANVWMELGQEFGDHSRVTHWYSRASRDELAKALQIASCDQPPAGTWP